MKTNTELISLLLHSQQQAHVFHFVTRSYAQHKALEEYYTKISDLLDTYTEVFQGAYGLVTDYKTYPIIDNPKKVIVYFENLLKKINATVVNDSYLSNILDNIYELVYRTIYKLKYLN
jgi:hypothetical protein